MKTKNLSIFMLLCVMTLSAMMGCTGKLTEEPQENDVPEEQQEYVEPDKPDEYVDEYIEPEEYEEYTKEPLLFTYSETGKYGLNILAEDFVEGKKMGNGRNITYSVRAKLPDGKSSLKIVIKPTKPAHYRCMNYVYSPIFDLCDAKFNEWHEICPKCGGVNKLQMQAIPLVGFYQGSDVNWLVTNVVSQFTFTYVDELVHTDGNVADASVTLEGDFMIEYYENGATEPIKVKKVKVID